MINYADYIFYEDGSFPEKHEKRVARILVKKYQKKIKFLAPNRAPGARTPDVEWQKLRWEIKSPKGQSSRTIENNFRAAIKQSENVIFDLSRLNLPTVIAIRQIQKQFDDNRGACRVIIITKTEKIIDIER